MTGSGQHWNRRQQAEGIVTIKAFTKYHALGNDYLVIEPIDGGTALTPETIRRICDRHYGLGSDGILVGPFDTGEADFALALYNPDGSAFEKSGNGLRIFARYLWDTGRVDQEAFTISTPGGLVTARVHKGGARVTVAMGQVSFHSSAIPVAGPLREVLDETMPVAGQMLRYSCATIGNPHCVVLRDKANAHEARTLGPHIEHDARFPNRTNVQFMAWLDRSRIQIEIWERGAGYTLASGSSSCAAAAVAHRLGLCDPHVVVYMPGGEIEIEISRNWEITMTGGVTRVCQGQICAEMLAYQV
ncbi:MAG: diaminopimelate epimerase [Anaerolineae bacterium]|nr:diaminopimelate epimerase [Anaerolineae bacterium]